MTEIPVTPTNESLFFKNPFGDFRPTGLRAVWLNVCHAMPTRRLAVWMRKPLKKAFASWVDVELWGLRLRLASKGNLTEQRLLYMPRHYDSRERALIQEVLTDGACFFDIGANAGAYSLFAASCGILNLRIEAFEPDPNLCLRFRSNIEENALSSIHLNEIALGAEDGMLFLVQGDRNLGQNEVVQSGSGSRVRVRSLASIIREKHISKIDLLKIDIEGHEKEVLEPFFRQVERICWPHWVICECLNGKTITEGEQVLQAVGYKLVEQTRMNGIYRLPDG